MHLIRGSADVAFKKFSSEAASEAVKLTTSGVVCEGYFVVIRISSIACRFLGPTRPQGLGVIFVLWSSNQIKTVHICVAVSYWTAICRGPIILQNWYKSRNERPVLSHQYRQGLWVSLCPKVSLKCFISLPRVQGFWYWFGGVCSLTYCNENFRVTMVSEPFNVIV